MEKLKVMLENARAAFSRLSQREQTIVLLSAAGFVLVILLGIGMLVSSAIERGEHRLKVKTDQLQQILSMQGEYKARQQERAEKMRILGRSNVRLVSLVEDAAKQSGVEIGQLRPEDGEASADGVIESRVDLRASGLSSDRLTDFLSRIEKSPGVVVVRRLKLTRPYRKDTVDVEMTVTTYKVKT